MARDLATLAPAPDIMFEQHGTAGIITLNRPKAMNALTHPMVHELSAKLTEWAKDSSVTRVVIKANAARAFSAGGDIRALYDFGKSGNHADALAFWRDEYTLNALIKRYPKPYVALIDGIAMGGGVGISIHGSHRVAGDRFLFAMPEVGIGFFPDVGATWFLPRLAGEVGTYCALTGQRLRNADAVPAGVATHYVASSRFAEVLEALTGAQSVDSVLNHYSERLGTGPLAAHRDAIDRLFIGNKVEDIITALDQEAISGSSDAGFAGATAAVIRGKSPLSLKIALSQLRRGKSWSFTDCMKAEYRIAFRIVYGHDFYEGVRALIIDKNLATSWNPPTLAQVTDEEVERHFAPIEQELVL
jgi:enoyl-CoA hydratase